jgi:lipoprotein NlpD
MAHIVASGDTAWGIAIRYGLTLDQLMAFNNLAADTMLHIGDALWIRPTFTPIASPTSSATATAVGTPEPFTVANIPPPTTFTATPSPSPRPPTPTVVATATTAVPPTNSLSQTLYRGSMIASVGLLIAAGVIILAMRKNNDSVDV